MTIRARIAGTGMYISLFTTLTLLPALLTLNFNGRRFKAHRASRFDASLLQPLTSRPRIVIGVTVVIAVASLATLAMASSDPKSPIFIMTMGLTMRTMQPSSTASTVTLQGSIRPISGFEDSATWAS